MYDGNTYFYNEICIFIKAYVVEAKLPNGSNADLRNISNITILSLYLLNSKACEFFQNHIPYCCCFRVVKCTRQVKYNDKTGHCSTNENENILK